MGVIVGTACVARWRALKPLAPPELLLLAYGLIALFSVFWSIVPTFTFIRAVQLLTLFGLAVVSVRVIGPDAAIRAASGSLVIFVLMSATAAASGMPWASESMKTDYTGFTRFTWFAVHPISAATQAGLAAVSVCARVHRSARLARSSIRDSSMAVSGRARCRYWACYSRGPTVGGARRWGGSASEEVALRHCNHYSPPVATLFIVAVLATREFGGGQTEGGDNAITHAFFRGQDAKQLTGLSGRVELWEAAMPAFPERPVFGMGIMAARPILLRYASWAGYAHNVRTFRRCWTSASWEPRSMAGAGLGRPRWPQAFHEDAPGRATCVRLGNVGFPWRQRRFERKLRRHARL